MQRVEILAIAPTPFFADRGCHIRVAHYLTSRTEPHERIILLTYPIGRDFDLRGRIFTIQRVMKLMPWYARTDPGPDFFRLIYDGMLTIVAIVSYVRFRPRSVIGFLPSSAFALCAIRFLRRILHRQTLITLDLQDVLAESLRSYGLLGSLMSPFARTYERFMVRVPDRITTNSPRVTDYYLAADTLHRHSRFELVPDTPHPGIIERSRTAHAGHPVCFIYTGGLYPQKRLEDIFRFFSSHHDAFDYPFRVVIAGSGDPAFVQGLIRRYAVAIDLHIPLLYERLPSILDRADIGIEPKRESSEGSGKIENYLAAGMAVLMHQSFFEYHIQSLAIYRDRILFFEDVGVFSLARIERALMHL